MEVGTAPNGMPSFGCDDGAVANGVGISVGSIDFRSRNATDRIVASGVAVGVGERCLLWLKLRMGVAIAMGSSVLSFQLRTEKKSLSLAVRCSDCERYSHGNCVGNVSGLRQDGMVVQIGVYEYWVSVMGFWQCATGFQRGRISSPQSTLQNRHKLQRNMKMVKCLDCSR
ncbi:hypothetical protein F0562_012800 [Nyssa sinensis]|uniref:Uncharacterized protein n=1 Tax=Nyssa sinensis TaxID=561372 RepID=A0A5J4ZVT7_9ASTE|nr:hypothetical protein F0562_012800 [Nyssa sinensis]